MDFGKKRRRRKTKKDNSEESSGDNSGDNSGVDHMETNFFGKRTKKTKKHKKTKKCKYCLVRNKIRKVYKFEGLVGMRYAVSKRKVPKGTRCYKLLRDAKKAKARKTKKTKRSKKSKRSKKTKQSKLMRWCYRNRKLIKIIIVDGRPCYYESMRKFPYNLKMYSSKTDAIIAMSRRLNKYSSSQVIPRSLLRSAAIARALRRNQFGNVQKSSINPANKFNYEIQQYATNASTPTIEQLEKIQQTAAYDYPTNKSNQSWFYSKNNNDGYGF